MKHYERAWRYLWRKKVKTVLLFLVLLVSGTMILSTTVILTSMQEAKREMQEKTKAKVKMGILTRDNPLTVQDVEKIRALEQVSDINLMTRGEAYSVNFDLVRKNDDDSKVNQMASVQAWSDPESDGAFADQSYRLAEGGLPGADSDNGIVINFLLAEQNGLNVGDKLEFEAADGKAAAGVITGIFTAGTERQQSDAVSALHRIENQIYVTPAMFEQVFGKEGYETVVVYTAEPEELGRMEEQLQGLFGEKSEAVSSDVLYRQMKAPLEQVGRIAGLMRGLTVITAAAVVTLLLCMWMKVREKEFAVLISIGEAKINLLWQVMIESVTVFLGSVCGAYVIVQLLSGILQDVLLTSAGAVQLQVHAGGLGALLVIGGGLVIAAMAISMLPVFKTNPKDILAKMEG